MSDVIVDANTISKMYKLYSNPKDRLKEIVNPFRRCYHHEFWALKDVTFQLKRGESIGIIGKNGSGKSTLLKILTGVLTPTSGTFTINGTVSSLLELGAGFNPDLSGLENIFLQGLFHGIARTDMEKKVDDIAAFADIGEFLYQPVKMYSSGMFVRLAFACSVFVDPDILIVDEALSVGDIFFTHKCMRRIKQMIDAGTVLLFVSHDTDTVQRFCSKGLWLESGRVRLYGKAGKVTNAYVAASLETFTEVAEEILQTESQQENHDMDREALHIKRIKVGPIIDIGEKRLYTRGKWVPSLELYPDSSELAMITNDIDATVTFTFSGNELSLLFMRGEGWSDPAIWVDSEQHYFTKYFEQPGRGDKHIENITIALQDGQHDVVIRAANNDLPLGWLGGTTGKTCQIDYREGWHDPEYEKTLVHQGNGKARITCAEILEYNTGRPATAFQSGDWVRLRLHVRMDNLDTFPRIALGFQLRDKNQIPLFGTSCQQECQSYAKNGMNRLIAEWIFPLRLPVNTYSITVGITEYKDDLLAVGIVDFIDLALVIDITKCETYSYIFPANPPIISAYLQA